MYRDNLLHFEYNVQTKSSLVNTILPSIFKASRYILRDFGELENLAVSQKGLGEFVSSADKKSEQIITDGLLKLFSDYSILSEERGLIEGSCSENCWIIDPIDGTSNFLHGVPHFAISVALKKKNEIIAAVTFDPIQDELFWSEKGMGAYLNQRRIRVSRCRQFDQIFASYGTLNTIFGKTEGFMGKIEKVLPKNCGVRWMGSSSLALAYVAAGRFDMFFKENIKIWDMAAGALLVKEAGGYIGDPISNKNDSNILELNQILASNEFCYNKMKSML